MKAVLAVLAWFAGAQAAGTCAVCAAGDVCCDPKASPAQNCPGGQKCCDCNSAACACPGTPGPPTPPAPTPAPPPPAPTPVPPSPAGTCTSSDQKTCEGTTGCGWCFGDLNANKCFNKSTSSCCGTEHSTVCDNKPDTTCCGGFWAEDFASCCTDGGTCSNGIRHTGCCAKGRVACQQVSLYAGCCDEGQKCCGSALGEGDSWCCDATHGICCGSAGGGSGQTCCDSRSEVCLANGTCAPAGGKPTGCGGQCTSDSDCVMGGSVCNKCVPGPTGDYHVCGVHAVLTEGSPKVTEVLVGQVSAPQNMSALSVDYNTTTGADTMILVNITPTGSGCTADSWWKFPGVYGRHINVKGCGYQNPLPCVVILSNALPPPATAGASTIGFFPFTATSQCVTEVTVTRADDSSKVTDIGLGSNAQVDLGHSASLTVGEGADLDPLHTPYLLTLDSQGCSGDILAAVRLTNNVHTIAAGSTLKLALTVDVPSTTLFNLGSSGCKVDAKAKRLPITHLPATNPASHEFSVDLTDLESTVVTQDQPSSPDYPVCGPGAPCNCVDIKVTSGVCCVDSTTNGYGYIYPLKAGMNTSFPLSTVNVNGTTIFSSRLDFSTPSSSTSCDDNAAASPNGGCSGTVTFRHKKDCY